MNNHHYLKKISTVKNSVCTVQYSVYTTTGALHRVDEQYNCKQSFCTELKVSLTYLRNKLLRFCRENYAETEREEIEQLERLSETRNDSIRESKSRSKSDYRSSRDASRRTEEQDEVQDAHRTEEKEKRGTRLATWLVTSR